MPLMMPQPGQNRMPLPGGMPGPQAGGDIIKEKQSLLNPTDLALMQKEGKITAGATVRDALEELGIDVDGPVEQLTQFAKKQLSNATAMGKFQGMNQAPMPGPQPGPQPRMGMPRGMPRRPPEEPGMNNLLNKMQ